jgi:hypothetical protein
MKLYPNITFMGIEDGGLTGRTAQNIMQPRGVSAQVFNFIIITIKCILQVVI